MRICLLILSMLIAGSSMAQQSTTVECRTGENFGPEILLFRVENGKKEAIAKAAYHKNGYYGFMFIPEYEGFYVIGDARSYQYPVYLKPGDEVALYMDQDTVYLTGKKNTPENKVLYDWIALSRNIETKAVRFYRARSTYRDFFPEFEAFLPAADRFKTGIKTKNPRFNELMKRSIDFEKDLYALTFIYTPRSEHPKREQRPAYYAGIIDPDKFKDDVILEMPYGMDLVNRYLMHASLEKGVSGGSQETRLAYIPNDRVKGEIVVGNAAGKKSYFEFKKYAGENEKYLNAGQKARVEAIGSKLYEMRKGQPAADFSYPDAAGKQVSLSDFRGKVVVVDVWATWCGPCKAELPHLKKLEEEMKGKDVVFVGVSLDKEKDLDKWKKFIQDENLPGVQLFAGGWSKIAEDYKITGIPRFMVFDREGNVVEAKAPRPSSPNLKALIEEELKKNQD